MQSSGRVSPEVGALPLRLQCGLRSPRLLGLFLFGWCCNKAVSPEGSLWQGRRKLQDVSMLAENHPRSPPVASSVNVSLFMLIVCLICMIVYVGFSLGCLCFKGLSVHMQTHTEAIPSSLGDGDCKKANSVHRKLCRPKYCQNVKTVFTAM